jgi:hypothetical protein
MNEEECKRALREALEIISDLLDHDTPSAMVARQEYAEIWLKRMREKTI